MFLELFEIFKKVCFYINKIFDVLNEIVIDIGRKGGILKKLICLPVLGILIVFEWLLLGLIFLVIMDSLPILTYISWNLAMPFFGCSYMPFKVLFGCHWGVVGLGWIIIWFVKQCKGN